MSWSEQARLTALPGILRRSPLLLLGGLLLLYLSVSLDGLAVVPPVYEDEPWQASTAWKLASEGVFGSDMFAGFYGMERRYYGFMPIHPLLMAGVLRLAGLGLLQIRLEPVLLGLLVLLLTYALGRRLFGVSVGVLAVALLLLVRLSGLTPSQLSGILLLDMARIARYDMAVPVFGLAALYTYLSARDRAAGSGYLLAGLLAGLAGLSHLYGVFWLPALALLALWDGAGWRGLARLAAGFAAPWLVYASYVLADLPAWAGQTRIYAPRFELLRPAWYWSNLLQEPQRYGPGLGAPGWHYLLRPGFWLMLCMLPGALLALAWRAVRAGDRAARALVVPALLLPTLFALLIQLKLANYMLTYLPLGALAAAWGARQLWRQAQRWRWRRPLRALLLLSLLGISVEGFGRIVALRAAAARTTPYADFIGQVRGAIPTGARVVGLHHYWLGLHDLEYRSWFVPILQSDPRYWTPPLQLTAALETLAPDVLLIDNRMQEFFAQRDQEWLSVQRWMRQQGFVLAHVVDDATYGRIEIYRRRQ